MISVVIPCYNSEKTIVRCVRSVQLQTYKEFEIVLVNDGSKDSTGLICDRLASEDERIKVLHQENKGLMAAWKRGVNEANGEYIAFCDSDDYINNDFIETIVELISSYKVDLILFGMNVEYDNGVIDSINNRLEGKLYLKENINKEILPHFFFNGDMQSEIMLLSRCSKVFRKEILVQAFPDLNNRVSYGEDDLTSFMAVLLSKSIYCIDNFYPYHYMRNKNSMIGRYDDYMVEKCEILRNEIYVIADKYHYRWKNQIEAHFLSNVLLCVKKEISRNALGKYWKIKEKIRKIRNSDTFSKALANADITNYNLKSKIFVKLIYYRQYCLLIVLTKLMTLLNVGRD